MVGETEIERYRRIARQIGDDPNFMYSVNSLVMALHEHNSCDAFTRRALVGELIVGLRSGLRNIAIQDVSADEIDDLCGAAMAAALDAVVLMPFHGGVA